MDKITCNAYIEILKRELVMAMGCTEPIAVAYAAAVAANSQRPRLFSPGKTA